MPSKTQLLNKLVKAVCAKEKGKKQLDAGNAREVIKVITKLINTDSDFDYALYCYGVEFLKARKK